MAKRAVTDFVAFAADKPLVLTGPPALLRGSLPLYNPGTSRTLIRGARLSDPKGVLGQPLQQRLPAVYLKPEQERKMPLMLSVDRATPPGEYQIELEVEGQTRSVILQVTEVFDLSLTPRSLVLLNQGGAQTKRLMLSNDGNVAVTLGPLGPVDLKDDLLWDRALRVAVEPVGTRNDVDLEELIVSVLKVAREDAFFEDALSVNIVNGPITLAPGETAALDLEFTLSDGLPQNSRYRGILPVLTEDLEIVVVSGGEIVAQAAKAPAKKRASTRSSTSKSTKKLSK